MSLRAVRSEDQYLVALKLRWRKPNDHQGSMALIEVRWHRTVVAREGQGSLVSNV